MDEATATAQARQHRRSATDHKRAAARHRREAKDEMQKLAALEAICDEFGITLIFEDEEAIVPDPTAEIAAQVTEDLQEKHSNHTQPRRQSDDTQGSDQRQPEAEPGGRP